MLPERRRRHATTIRRSRTSSTTSSSSTRRRRSACGCSWSPKCCSSAACSSTYLDLPRAGIRTAFAAAQPRADVIWAGTINTVVLITSSLTMALAVHAAQTGERRQLLLLFLVLTMVLGSAFLGVKAFEYYTSSTSTTYPGRRLPVRAGVLPATRRSSSRSIS